jgi:hypothetical protein
MNHLANLLTAIAREHLFIETLKERKSDRLDFHNVSVWGVTDALLAAYQAGQRAAGAPEPLILLQDIASAMHAGGMRKPKDWLKRIDRTIAEALAASSPPAHAATVPPIIVVTVRGGLIEDLDATIPIHAVIEDHDVEDFDTGKKPARSVWKLTGGLSGPKAEKLHRLIAND